MALGLLLQKMIHEQRHIFQTFTQRWNLDRNNRQPIVKIFAKSPVFQLRQQGLVRRAHHADIYRRALVVADATDFSLLQNAQKFCLQLRRHGIDFIEKNRAEIRLFKQSALVRDCAGKRALFVTEQFRLEQILR